MNFTDKKVSAKKAIAILAKKGIQVNDDEAAVILDFMYLMAKNFNKHKEEKSRNLKEKSNPHEKDTINGVKEVFLNTST